MIKLSALLKSQKGISLIELLAATVVIFLFIIPLSSVYLASFTVFQETTKQTNLRQELDFVIADIMNRIQYANYFEVNTSKHKEKEKDLFIELVNSRKLDATLNITESTRQAYHTDLSIYNIQVQVSNTDQPQSTVTKHTFQFEDFNYNGSAYLLYGLYSLDEEHQKLTTFLIIAPKTSENGFPIFVNQKQASYTDLQEIRDYVISNPSPFDYIRFVKTEFSVSNSQ